MSALEPDPPPAGEEIHLPGPTVMPLVATLGITMALIGVLEGWVLWVPGVLLTLGVAWRWIRDTQREIDELPLEHRH
jgi:hypothetical protein